MTTPVFKLSAIALAVSLSACSVLEGDKVDYRSAAKAPDLSIPPDLSQIAKDSRYNVGGAPTTPTSAAAAAAPSKPALAALSIADVRIERLGNQRWLVVKRAPEALWDPIRAFWQDSGFLLAMDQSELGIMETDWAENRAKIAEGGVRGALSRMLDSLYSTPERDKFRTRLERNANGETEIFISHRGMIEVYINEKDKQTVWQPRPADAELEAEFLRRLMVKLGASTEQAQTLTASATPAPSTSKVRTQDSNTVLELSDDFDRAWRRVGLSLDRTGFTVEDRDRKQGIYFVRYIPPQADKSEPGFFSRLFSSSNNDNGIDPNKYRIVVQTQAGKTSVRVQNSIGQAETSETAQRILKVLADDIR